MSDQMNYEAPRPNPGQLTVTIPLSYFNLLVESYYAGRGHNEPPAPVAPQVEENDLAFIKQNDFKVLLCHCNFNQPGVTDLFSKTCFSITCVRDPFSRSLSHYYHFIRNDNRAFSDLTNDEILSIIPRIAPNLLTSRLSGFQDNLEIALQNVKHINCILIFENLKNDIISLNNILNDVTHSKLKLNMAFRNVRSSYSEKDYARIKQFHQYFQNDILLYNTIVKMGAKNRFRIKC